jgi:hypothetical protein
MTPEIQLLTDRLQRLERQNRRLRRTGIAVLLLLAAIVLMGQARPPRTLTAQKFILTDASGIIRAELGTFQGFAHLFLYGDKECPRQAEDRCVGASIAAYKNGVGSIDLHDSNGVPGVRMDGYGILHLHGPDGYPRVLLEATTDGAVLNLFGAGRKSKAHLATGSVDIRLPGPGEAVGIGLTDPDKVLRSGFQIFSDVPGPSLILEDKEGFSTVVGSVKLQTPSTGESHRTSAASAVLFSKNGNVLWSVP